MECRRCAGKGKVTGEDADCFVCHGRGTVEVPPERLAEYFLKLKRKNDKVRRS